MNYQELINAEIKAADALLAAVNSEERVFSAEEKEKYDAHLAKAEELQAAKADFEASEAKRASFKKPEARKGVSAPSARVEVGEPEFTKDEKMGFNNTQDFFKAVVGEAKATGNVTGDERLRYLGAAGSDEHRVTDNSSLGFLIPRGLMGGVLEVTPESDPTMGRTNKIPMSNSTIDINARTDKNHTSSVTGGLTVSRTPETVAATSSKMKIEQITLKANELTGVSFVTNTLLNESPVSVAALLGNGFEQEFASKIFQEKLSGSGTGEMEGIMNSNALVTVAKESAQTADTIVFENIVKMYARLWGKNNGLWIANHNTLPQLADLGSDTVMKNIWMPSSVTGAPSTLFGLPIVFSEYTETLGDKGDIILCDWSQYLEGDFQTMQNASSTHVRFLEREQTFLFSMMNDGRSHWKEALTPKKGADTLSPFVTLAARA